MNDPRFGRRRQNVTTVSWRWSRTGFRKDFSTRIGGCSNSWAFRLLYRLFYVRSTMSLTLARFPCRIRWFLYTFIILNSWIVLNANKIWGWSMRPSQILKFLLLSRYITQLWYILIYIFIRLKFTFINKENTVFVLQTYKKFCLKKSLLRPWTWLIYLFFKTYET